MEDPCETVEALEERLLQGRFRDALASSNCLLLALSHQRLPQPSHHVPVIHSFSLWQKSFHMKVHLETSEKDRIGAVTLQSWYELWKQHQVRVCEGQLQQPNDAPSRINDEESPSHLATFLEVFCTESESMSVELAWIWVNLLWTIHERSTSAMLAMELWKFALKSDESYRMVPEQGLLCFISEVLPHLRLAVDHAFWESWYEVDKNPDFNAAWKRLSHHPTKEALESLLATLPKLCEKLALSAAVSEELKCRLEMSSQNLDRIGSHQWSTTHYLDDALVSTGIRNGEFPNRVLRHLRYKIVEWIRTWVLAKGSSDGGPLPSPRHRALVVAVFVVSGWVTWRNSRKFLILIRHLVHAAVLPVQELLEAFIPRRTPTQV